MKGADAKITAVPLSMVKVGGGNFFFESQVAKMRVLGWLDAFRAVKLALQHSCEKASLRL